MQQNKIEIHTKEGTEVLEIRQGDALKPIELDRYTTSGNLESPKKFYLKNKCLVQEYDSLVLVDQKNIRITLIIGYNHPHQREITGVLLLDPEYEDLHINRNKMYSRSDLVRKLKFLRRYFPKPSDCTDLVDKFKSLESNIDLRIKQADDNRGNKTDLLEQTIEEVNFPESFQLNIPIVLGGKPESIDITINFDLKNGTYLEFWLESVDAKDKEYEVAKNQLEESVKEFEEDDSLPVLFK